MCGAGGRDILTGIVAGYDVTCKVSQALGPAQMYERGFHPTAVAGCFGATAAAGRVLGLSVEQMTHAFGIALSEAAGSMQYLRNGAWTQALPGRQRGPQRPGRRDVRQARLHPARWTRWKVASACSTPTCPIAQPDKAVAGLRQVWEVMTTGIKPYPACRLSHAPADLRGGLLRQTR